MCVDLKWMCVVPLYRQISLFNSRKKIRSEYYFWLSRIWMLCWLGERDGLLFYSPKNIWSFFFFLPKLNNKFKNGKKENPDKRELTIQQSQSPKNTMTLLFLWSLFNFTIWCFQKTQLTSNLNGQERKRNYCGIFTTSNAMRRRFFLEDLERNIYDLIYALIPVSQERFLIGTNAFPLPNAVAPATKSCPAKNLFSLFPSSGF